MSPGTYLDDMLLLTFLTWLKGPLSSVTVNGTTIVLLHSLELAVELFDKRSAIYSSRPRMPFVNEL